MVDLYCFWAVQARKANAPAERTVGVLMTFAFMALELFMTMCE